MRFQVWSFLAVVALLGLGAWAIAAKTGVADGMKDGKSVPASIESKTPLVVKSKAMSQDFSLSNRAEGAAVGVASGGLPAQPASPLRVLSAGIQPEHVSTVEENPRALEDLLQQIKTQKQTGHADPVLVQEYFRLQKAAQAR